MAKRKTYRAKVINDFSKYNNSGTLKEYKIGDIFITNHLQTIEYLKLIKKIK